MLMLRVCDGCNRGVGRKLLVVRLRATFCSLIIHEQSQSTFCKSVGCMELSFMVLCKIDKYYNQMKFQVHWPCKVESGI